MSLTMMLILVIAAGTVLPVQAGINSTLAKVLGNPLHAAFISFLGGTILFAVLSLVLFQKLPEIARIQQTPVYLMIGGFLGGVMVLTAIMSAPRLGAALLTGSLVTGQLMMSLILDHYGVLGFPHHPVTPLRLLGAGFLLSGLALIKFY